MSRIDVVWKRIAHVLSLSRSRVGIISGEERQSAVAPLPVKSVRVRHPIALMRLLDADCPSCRGFGCTVCAGTGLG
jgi:hypothetical protein